MRASHRPGDQLPHRRAPGGLLADFLYRTPSLRARIEQVRAQPRRATASEPPARDESTSNVVRQLAAQLADEKRRRREEVAALQAELAAAHGELLALRRQLAVGQPRPAA